MRRLPRKDSVARKSMDSQSILSPSVNQSDVYGINELARLALANQHRFDLYRKYSNMINPAEQPISQTKSRMPELSSGKKSSLKPSSGTQSNMSSCSAKSSCYSGVVRESNSKPRVTLTDNHSLGVYSKKASDYENQQA